MKFNDYLKDKILVIVANILVMIFISLYLISIGNKISEISLIVFIWSIVFIVSFLLVYRRRKKYLEKLMHICEGLEERYLIKELMDKPQTSEDEIYQSIIKLSNKSMIEKITKIQNERKEYKEFIEQWVHEIKTPIAAIKLICDNNKIIPYKLLDELERIEDYVEQSLFYAKSEIVEKDYFIKEISLENVVEDTIRENKRLFLNHKISVVIDCPHSVFTDSKWISFILNQIIINAVKYKATTIQFSSVENLSGVSLSIKDNGIGISQEDLPRVFDKGFTGENGRKYHKSTGIGLYLCKRLCEKLGLKIKVYSEKDVFTEVEISFPISDFVKMEER